MPRGIPKDPNHPRNKGNKKTEATAAAPKKRGRPPGKKNAVKGEASPKTAKLPGAPTRGIAVHSDTPGPSSLLKISVAQNALTSLAAVFAAVPTNKLLLQAVEDLAKEVVTRVSEFLSPPTAEEETPAKEEVVVKTAPTAPVLTAVPSNVPTAPLPGFMPPPPFPTNVSQS